MDLPTTRIWGRCWINCCCLVVLTGDGCFPWLGKTNAGRALDLYWFRSKVGAPGIKKNWETSSIYHHIYIYTYINIYIYGHPPPGAIRALGAGVIILDNYIINMITCSNTLQISVKNASWMHMTLNIVTIQKGKNHQFPENRICFLKRVKSIFKL